jgi:serine/threonine-protein kinase
MRWSPGTIVDRYEIIEQLGAGAYAETYLARCHDADDRLVVIKSPNPALLADVSIFQRYQRESAIARSLSHPHVQGAVDDAAHRSEHYLVLEYVEGDNLRERERSLDPHRRGVPIDIAVQWGRELALGLSYLHSRGVVHRDLKPENVLVDTDGHLKIADFGTALLDGAKRLTWKHLTEGLGTPDYMSPEQIQGGRGDHRSDIYAWGVMMYELITGQAPFKGDNWMATMAGHLTQSPAPPTKRRRDCPEALSAVVMHAMRRWADNRYDSADALLADLDRLDTLDPASFHHEPEEPMGGLSAASSSRRMWLIAVAVAAGFLVVSAIIILLTVSLS